MSTPLLNAYDTPSLPTAPSGNIAPPVEPTAGSSEPARPPPWREWLREPLLHFVLLGGVLFAFDHVLLGKADDPHRIVVTREIEKETVGTFEAVRGRKPNAEELEALHRVWLDNEVLYREGLALGVDKGDPAIRERVIFKALSVVDSGVKQTPTDDKALKAWFEEHRAKYDEPPRYDFDEAALPGDNSEAAIQGLVKSLNEGRLEDGKAALRMFKARPRPSLVDSFGPELTRALASSPRGTWQALKASDGWHAMRLNVAIAARPADFEILRGMIFNDWKDANASEQRSAAVHALAKKYEVKFEAPSGSPKK